MSFRRFIYVFVILGCMVVSILGLTDMNKVPRLFASSASQSQEGLSEQIFMPLVLSRFAGVNTTVDGTDWNPGDGRCETAPGNNICTLRGLIQETNANPGPDTIFVPAGTYVLTIAGTDEDEGATGDLDIQDDLTIIGADPTTTIVNGNQIDRVFHIEDGSAHISNITITNGRVTGNANGGGIFGQAPLTLVNSVVSNNQSVNNGGGIYVLRTTIIEQSIIRNNKLVDNGIGGGLFLGSIADAFIFQSSFLTNTLTGTSTGNRGGGIYNESNLTVTIEDSTIQGNYSTFSGGGIYHDPSNLTARMNLNRVTLRKNVAPSNGGGIYSLGYMYLINVTLSENESTGPLNEEGGGIYVKNSFLSAVNSTIAENVAETGGGIYETGTSTVVFENSIMVDNIATGIYPGDATTHNCFGTINSAGNNLEDGIYCNFNAPGDISGVDPLLMPLTPGLGWTSVYPLSSGSPAIDKGNNATCPPVDQRGLNRPVDGDGNGSMICDIGSYEYP